MPLNEKISLGSFVSENIPENDFSECLLFFARPKIKSLSQGRASHFSAAR